jgi:hypothetical protein
VGEVLGWLTRTDLTDPEVALVAAAMTGTWCELRSNDPAVDDPALAEQWGPERTIRAQVLYQLLTDSGKLWPDDHDEVPTPRGVRACGARISGPLDLEAATLRCPLHLHACYLDCDEPVVLREARASAVRLTACRLPSGLEADYLRTAGDLDLRWVRAEDEVRLLGAHVGGQLDLTGGTFRNSGGYAISAHGLRIDGTGFWQPNGVTGALHLGFARATVWVDDATARSTPTVLHGFRYETLHPGPDEVGPGERIAWLDRDPAGYSPQPYAQLAAIYRAEGHDRHAGTVLVASQDRRRRRRPGWRSWPHWAWGGLLRAAVGYGYRPWLALLWLLVLVTIGTLLITWRPDAELTANPGAPPRNALLYTVDVLLPFVDLGYSNWVARGIVLIVTAILVVLEWVLVTAVVAAFVSVLRRGD